MMIWEVQRKLVKAELIHNPYLLETSVKFNGHEPKINSLVEKYRADKLQDWIARLPDIFYNEMNGWDFDLDFSGTKIDFECLQAAFDSAGVSRESVCLFHKNELENVERKNSEISDLLAWFDNNINRKFNFSNFREWKNWHWRYMADSIPESLSLKISLPPIYRRCAKIIKTYILNYHHCRKFRSRTVQLQMPQKASLLQR
jgi:hypothetical protein